MTRAAIYAILAATAIVYAAMVLWSLPSLSAIAETAGLSDARMFDMRPGGYDFGTAKSLLAALGEAGRERYLSVQHRLDTVFPLLNGLAMAIGLTFVAGQLALPRKIAVPVVAVLALAVAGLDLAENAAVATMLRAGPDGLTSEMVAAASRLSVLKSAVVSVALTLLLAGLSITAYRLGRKRWGTRQ